MDKNIKEIVSEIVEVLHKKGQDSIKEDVLCIKLDNYNLSVEQVQDVKDALINQGIKIIDDSVIYIKKGQPVSENDLKAITKIITENSSNP